jgi:hypothetical protein
LTFFIVKGSTLQNGKISNLIDEDYNDSLRTRSTRNLTQLDTDDSHTLFFDPKVKTKKESHKIFVKSQHESSAETTKVNTTQFSLPSIFDIKSDNQVITPLKFSSNSKTFKPNTPRPNRTKPVIMF